jgi:hypothetical protein
MRLLCVSDVDNVNKLTLAPCPDPLGCITGVDVLRDSIVILVSPQRRSGHDAANCTFKAGAQLFLPCHLIHPDDLHQQGSELTLEDSMRKGSVAYYFSWKSHQNSIRRYVLVFSAVSLMPLHHRSIILTVTDSHNQPSYPPQRCHQR